MTLCAIKAREIPVIPVRAPPLENKERPGISMGSSVDFKESIWKKNRDPHLIRHSFFSEISKREEKGPCFMERDKSCPRNSWNSRVLYSTSPLPALFTMENLGALSPKNGNIDDFLMCCGRNLMESFFENGPGVVFVIETYFICEDIW